MIPKGGNWQRDGFYHKRSGVTTGRPKGRPGCCHAAWSYALAVQKLWFWKPCWLRSNNSHAQDTKVKSRLPWPMISLVLSVWVVSVISSMPRTWTVDASGNASAHTSVLPRPLAPICVAMNSPAPKAVPVSKVLQFLKLHLEANPTDGAAIMVAVQSGECRVASKWLPNYKSWGTCRTTTRCPFCARGCPTPTRRFGRRRRRRRPRS